jgi:hypothetical protein
MITFTYTLVCMARLDGEGRVGGWGGRTLDPLIWITQVDLFYDDVYMVVTIRCYSAILRHHAAC